MTVQQVNTSIDKQVQQTSALSLRTGHTFSVCFAQQACEQEQHTSLLTLDNRLVSKPIRQVLCVSCSKSAYLGGYTETFRTYLAKSYHKTQM